MYRHVPTSYAVLHPRHVAQPTKWQSIPLVHAVYTCTVGLPYTTGIPVSTRYAIHVLVMYVWLRVSYVCAI